MINQYFNILKYIKQNTVEDLLIEYSDKKYQSTRKKRFLFIIGVIMIVGALYIIIYQLSSSISLRLFFSALANLLIGIYFILHSIEHRLLYPVKFIHISSEYVEFKLGRFWKTKKIEWNSIERIIKKKNLLDFYSGDQNISLRMIHFPSSDEKRIKSKISIIAEYQGTEIE